MASKKPSKKEIDLVVPEFVSTFGTSLKPSAQSKKPAETSPSQHTASPNQQSTSPSAAFNSMQMLPSSPVKQALAQAQHNFGSRSIERAKDSHASAQQIIQVPEFISTYPKTLRPKSSASHPSVSNAVQARSTANSDDVPGAEATVVEPAVSSEEISEELMDAVLSIDAAAVPHFSTSTQHDAAVPLFSTSTQHAQDRRDKENVAAADGNLALRSETQSLEDQRSVSQEQGSTELSKADRKHRKRKVAAAAAAAACDSVVVPPITSSSEQVVSLPASDDAAAGVSLSKSCSTALLSVPSTSQSPRHAILSTGVTVTHHESQPRVTNYTATSISTTLERNIEITSQQSSELPAPKGKATWWKQSQLRRFVLRLPQQRNFSCQFESRAAEEPATSELQALRQQLIASTNAHACSAREVKILSQALARHHESSSREMQLGEKSTRALTSHIETLQVSATAACHGLVC
jgi:hypothetical protein